MYTPSAPAFGAGSLGGGAGMGGGGFGGGGFGAGGVGIAGPIDSGLLTQRIRTTMFNIWVCKLLLPFADHRFSNYLHLFSA
jgi:hypothetical protein